MDFSVSLSVFQLCLVSGCSTDISITINLLFLWVKLHARIPHSWLSRRPDHQTYVCLFFLVVFCTTAMQWVQLQCVLLWHPDDIVSLISFQASFFSQNRYLCICKSIVMVYKKSSPNHWWIEMFKSLQRKCFELLELTIHLLGGVGLWARVWRRLR